MDSERTPATLEDGDGELVVTYLRELRDGRPFADLLAPAPGVTAARAVQAALEQLAGWGAGPELEFGRVLVAAGATAGRRSTSMELELGDARSPSEHPPGGVLIGPADAGIDELAELAAAAYGPEHPDHRGDAAQERRELEPLLAGEVVGPMVACSRVARGADGTLLGAALVFRRRDSQPPHARPWLAELVRDPHRAPRGTGSALLRAVIAAARADGHRALGLTVTAGVPARKLYERAGFVAVFEGLNVTLPKR